MKGDLRGMKRSYLRGKAWLAAGLVSVVLSGCGSTSGTDGNLAANQVSGGNVGGNAIRSDSMVEIAPIDPDEMFSDRDFETDYKESDCVKITLTGSSAACEGSGVEISGSTVTVKGEGTYLVSGSLDDGMIVVDGDKEEKVQLVFDDVSIHSSNNAPLFIKQSDKVFITLAKGSENVLSCGESFAGGEEGVDAAIFSKDDLTINGEGALTISSSAGHGVVSKDELTITGGVYDITAASHGLSGKDGIGIADGTFWIQSGKDGVHAENNDDASLGYLYVRGGSFNIDAADDGISAAGAMLLDGGTFAVNSVGDAVHSNGYITVNGGTFALTTEDDGFHADDTLTIVAGTIDISESYEGLEALHVDVQGGTISLVAADDGLNAAGGADSSGFGGRGGNDMFGGRGGGRFGGKMGGGKMPEGAGDDRGAQKGERPQMPEGKQFPENMPELPEGGMPGNPFGADASQGSITISGGNLYINASGDGIDANGTLAITGGNIEICGPNRGDTATLDYDSEGFISGGTFMGTGAAGMAQTFRDSEQAVVTVKVDDALAGSEVSLKTQSGETLLSCTPKMDFSVVIFSSPGLVKGEKYVLTVGSVTYEVAAE